MRSDGNDDGMLVGLRLLARGKLAVQEIGRHEMANAQGKPPSNEAAIALEIDKTHVFARADQNVAIDALERRAADHAVIAAASRCIDPGSDAAKPRPAIL